MSNKPELPPSYHLVQIVLALAGLVIGFSSWDWLEALGFSIIGKPDFWLYLIPMGLAIAFVRIHRSIVFRRMDRKANVSSEEDIK